jgi:hypothetical protein
VRNICPRAAGCGAPGSPAAGPRGQARLLSVVNVGPHAQGSAVRESISAGAGKQSRAELAVLAQADDHRAKAVLRTVGHLKC